MTATSPVDVQALILDDDLQASRHGDTAHPVAQAIADRLITRDPDLCPHLTTDPSATPYVARPNRMDCQDCAPTTDVADTCTLCGHPAARAVMAPAWGVMFVAGLCDPCTPAGTLDWQPRP